MLLKFFALRRFAFNCAALLRSVLANWFIVCIVVARLFGSLNRVMPATPLAQVSKHSFTRSREMPPSAIKGKGANSRSASDRFPKPSGQPYFSFDGQGQIRP